MGPQTTGNMSIVLARAASMLSVRLLAQPFDLVAHKADLPRVRRRAEQARGASIAVLGILAWAVLAGPWSLLGATAMLGFSLAIAGSQGQFTSAGWTFPAPEPTHLHWSWPTIGLSIGHVVSGIAATTLGPSAVLILHAASMLRLSRSLTPPGNNLAELAQFGGAKEKAMSPLSVGSRRA